MTHLIGRRAERRILALMLALVSGWWICPGSSTAGPKDLEEPAATEQAVPEPERTLAGFALFKIDAHMSLQQLLPVPPAPGSVAEPLIGDDNLERVAEVAFQRHQGGTKDLNRDHDRASYLMARIRHLNAKKMDRYMEALVGQRRDLAGLSFVMGNACRQQQQESDAFIRAVRNVHDCLTSTVIAPQVPVAEGGLAPENRATSVARGSDSKLFWKRFREVCREEDKKPCTAEARSRTIRGRIAALMQILAIEPAKTRHGLAEFLGTLPTVEATRALARLAVFSPEKDVQVAAVTALRGRNESQADDILLQGLRYPMPAVAARASQALTRLKRADLAPRLVDMLDQRDPRTPSAEIVEGKRSYAVREVVRVNHHRNCVMCHAPAATPHVITDLAVAPVPLPSQPLSGSYGPVGDIVARADILIRTDVTYLRQDFSLVQPVADSGPWPQMQRFDYLVRKRWLTEQEAAAYQAKLKPQSGKASPYQQAIVGALRELTGQDAEPTSAAWRQVLNLPKKRDS